MATFLCQSFIFYKCPLRSFTAPRICKALANYAILIPLRPSSSDGLMKSEIYELMSGWEIADRTHTPDSCWNFIIKEGRIGQPPVGELYPLRSFEHSLFFCPESCNGKQKGPYLTGRDTNFVKLKKRRPGKCSAQCKCKSCNILLKVGINTLVYKCSVLYSLLFPGFQIVSWCHVSRIMYIIELLQCYIQGWGKVDT